MGKTTLTVQEETLDRFNDTKNTPEGVEEPSADAFLNQLLDTMDEDGPEFTATAAIHPTLAEGSAEALREELERITEEGMADALDFPTSDVKEAVREVIREELPDGALR